MKSNAWIIDDDDSIRWVLEKALTGSGMHVTTFNNGAGIIELLTKNQPDIIISDIRMPGVNGIELMSSIHALYPNLPVIIMTAHSGLDSAVSAYKSGAFEYLAKPFDVDDVINVVNKALEQGKKRTSDTLQNPNQTPVEIIGEAPSMQAVFRAIGRLAQSHVNILINGETGTGKELVAQALHRHGPRASQPFIALNMAAIPRDLLESELFGHEKGSFTGADKQRQGRFEQADGGTLFLDEIGDMPLELQTRLLRILTDGQFFRVGGHTPVDVDVRIIAATHQNLGLRVQEGTFRDDLFHRLNVIRINVPSLRERREDIPLLTRHFMFRAAKEINIDPKLLNKDAQHFLCKFPWPGNVRQLENTCRWLTVMSPGNSIRKEDLPDDLMESHATYTTTGDWEKSFSLWVDQQMGNKPHNLVDRVTPLFERIMLENALKHTSGKKQKAADMLGWGRNTLTRKLKSLGVSLNR